MVKIIIAIIVIILIILFVWLVVLPPAQVVRLIVCPAAANDEPDLETRDTVISDHWYHPFGDKVKFKNDSNYDGVQITIRSTDFFQGTQSEVVFTLGIGESRKFTIRDDLPSGKICNFDVNPFCKTPGPTLIKRP